MDTPQTQSVRKLHVVDTPQTQPITELHMFNGFMGKITGSKP
jgi:hypothetical protein